MEHTHARQGRGTFIRISLTKSGGAERRPAKQFTRQALFSWRALRRDDCWIPPPGLFSSFLMPSCAAQSGGIELMAAGAGSACERERDDDDDDEKEDGGIRLVQSLSFHAPSKVTLLIISSKSRIPFFPLLS